MHKGKPGPGSGCTQASGDIDRKSQGLSPSQPADRSGGLAAQTPQPPEVPPRPTVEPDRSDEASSLDTALLLSALSKPAGEQSGTRPSPVNTVRIKRVKGHWIAYTAHSERYEKTFAGLGATPGEAVCELLSNLDTEMPLARMAELERRCQSTTLPAPGMEATESEEDEPLFLEEQLRQEGALVIPDNRRRRPS